MTQGIIKVHRIHDPRQRGFEGVLEGFMERRLHTRHRARTTVYIMMPTGKRRLCRAINLSANGVFIRTASLGLKKGQQVELAFAIDLGVVTKVHRRTAVVAHISGGGTGLMMDAYAAR